MRCVGWRLLCVGVLLGGCAPQSEASSASQTAGIASSTSTSGEAPTAGIASGMPSGEPVCAGVNAVFFDLGETLVVPAGDHFVEREGARELIATLKGAGIPVGIITDVPAGFAPMDLLDLMVNPEFLFEFDLVVMSSQVAAGPKPDPAFFMTAYDLLEDPPPIGQTAFVTEELAHIADREVMPTRGARAVGMLGIHLSDAEPSALADHRVSPSALLSIASATWLGCN